MLGTVQCGREAGSQVSVESLFCGSGTHPPKLLPLPAPDTGATGVQNDA